MEFGVDYDPLMVDRPDLPPSEDDVVLQNCPTCNEDLYMYPGEIYCSLDCANNRPITRNEKQREYKREWWRRHKAKSSIDTKICNFCGNEFTPKHGLQGSCSDECKHKRNLQRSKKYYKQGVTQINKTCRVCKKTFETSSTTKNTCSKECSKIYKRNYNREKYREEHPEGTHRIL